MKETRLVITKGNDPSLLLWLKQRDATTGAVTALALAGCTIEMYLKAQPTDVDGSATYSSSGVSPAITVLDSITGKAQVQMDHTTINAINPTWYRIDVVKNGNRVTVAKGELDIEAA